MEVLEALKASEVDDRIRQPAKTIYQALFEADLSPVIGASSSPSPACHGHVLMAGLRRAGLPQR
jgi:hypothetical protein